MAEELRLIQKQLIALLRVNIEALLGHVEDPKLLASSVTRLMGFMGAAQEISRRLLDAEQAILVCQFALSADTTNLKLKKELSAWESYQNQLVTHLKGLIVRLKNA